eukprot:8931032-Heterocapsa_arctica.AAC.1
MQDDVARRYLWIATCDRDPKQAHALRSVKCSRNTSKGQTTGPASPPSSTPNEGSHQSENPM